MAPILLVGSVTLMVVIEIMAAFAKKISIDPDASIVSVTAGTAYFLVKGGFSKLVMFSAMLWVYQFRIFDFGYTWWAWLTLFILRDFVYYWIHRAEHIFEWLWASHMVHHSSEQFTFTTAVRMPWQEMFYKPVLSLWIPLLGFNPVMSATIGAFVLMAGQIQHTEYVKRMPFIEKLFVTPSVHRVHHGSNLQYIDKNFGSMLSIWDHLFGTFEPESETVRYGLVGNKRISTIREALVGGYPELFRKMNANRNPRLFLAKLGD